MNKKCKNTDEYIYDKVMGEGAYECFRMKGLRVETSL